MSAYGITSEFFPRRDCQWWRRRGHVCASVRACATAPMSVNTARSVILDVAKTSLHLEHDIPLPHRNVPGERVHQLLRDLDVCWAKAAPLTPFGPRARWTRAVELFAAMGWPVRDHRRRWRAGEVTVDWSAVDPRR